MIRIGMVIGQNQNPLALEVWGMVDGLESWLARVCSGDSLVVGRKSAEAFVGKSPKMYVLTHDEGTNIGEGKLCMDPAALVKKFISSNDELVVVGGLSTFEFFLPHSAVLDIAVANRDGTLFPLVNFSVGEFDLVDEVNRGAFVTRKLFRI